MNDVNEAPHRDLSDFEVQELLIEQSPRNKILMRRLLTELRRLRDEAGAREHMANEEQTW